MIAETSYFKIKYEKNYIVLGFGIELKFPFRFFFKNESHKIN